MTTTAYRRQIPQPTEAAPWARPMVESGALIEGNVHSTAQPDYQVSTALRLVYRILDVSKSSGEHSGIAPGVDSMNHIGRRTRLATVTLERVDVFWTEREAKSASGDTVEGEGSAPVEDTYWILWFALEGYESMCGKSAARQATDGKVEGASPGAALAEMKHCNVVEQGVDSSCALRLSGNMSLATQQHSAGFTPLAYFISDGRVLAAPHLRTLLSRATERGSPVSPMVADFQYLYDEDAATLCIDVVPRGQTVVEPVLSLAAHLRGHENRKSAETDESDFSSGRAGRLWWVHTILPNLCDLAGGQYDLHDASINPSWQQPGASGRDQAAGSVQACAAAAITAVTAAASGSA